MTARTYDVGDEAVRGGVGRRLKRDTDAAMKRWEGSNASVLPIVQLHVLQAVSDRLEAIGGGAGS